MHIASIISITNLIIHRNVKLRTAISLVRITFWFAAAIFVVRLNKIGWLLIFLGCACL